MEELNHVNILRYDFQRASISSPDVILGRNIDSSIDSCAYWNNRNLTAVGGSDRFSKKIEGCGRRKRASSSEMNFMRRYRGVPDVDGIIRRDSDLSEASGIFSRILVEFCPFRIVYTYFVQGYLGLLGSRQNKIARETLLEAVSSNSCLWE